MEMQRRQAAASALTQRRQQMGRVRRWQGRWRRRAVCRRRSRACRRLPLNRSGSSSSSSRARSHRCPTSSSSRRLAWAAGSTRLPSRAYAAQADLLTTPRPAVQALGGKHPSPAPPAARPPALRRPLQAKRAAWTLWWKTRRRCWRCRQRRRCGQIPGSGAPSQACTCWTPPRACASCAPSC